MTERRLAFSSTAKAVLIAVLIGGTALAFLGHLASSSSAGGGNRGPRVRERAPRPAPAPVSWTRLLKRVFEIDIEHCPQCGGRARKYPPEAGGFQVPPRGCDVAVLPWHYW